MHRITLLITIAVLAALLELAISRTIYMHGIVKKIMLCLPLQVIWYLIS